MPAKTNQDPGSPLGDQLHQLPWLIMGLVMMLWILATYLATGVQATQIPYSEFKTMIRQQAFQEVILGPATVRGTAKVDSGEPPKTYKAVRPEDPDLLRELEARNVRYRVEAQNRWIAYVLSWVVPFVLLFLWRFFIGWVCGVDRNPMAIGCSKAKVYVNQDADVTFDDVAGIDEAKGELREVIEFLREPAKYRRLGGKIPKGVLLVRPPGTGKTLLAKAMTGEAKVPFFSISSSEFIELFVGVGTSRVRPEASRRSAIPCSCPHRTATSSRGLNSSTVLPCSWGGGQPRTWSFRRSRPVPRMIWRGPRTLPAAWSCSTV